MGDFASLRHKFDELFEDVSDGSPLYFVKAPGRLSILGEHIDYSGYGVLAFAIEQEISVVSRVNSLNVLRIRNLDANFSELDVRCADLSIDPKNIQWTDYVLCGFRGVAEIISKDNNNGDHLMSSTQGVDLLVSGRVPKSAGLSSSSALVCASALAFASCFGRMDISRTFLADVCAKCERYVGTQGGGLDQATCLLSEKGKALAIEFNPLKSECVSLPDGACFVVMNTLVAKSKAISPEYNDRVMECKLAASIIAKLKMGVGLESSSFLTLGEAQRKLDVSLDEMVSVAENCLQKRGYSREEIGELLDMPWNEIASQFPNFNKNLKEFKLKQRAIHVYNEAKRTTECINLCKNDDRKMTCEEKLKRIGTLMNECHTSCSQLFECSCDELDLLVKVGLAAGAYGVQLCGAGWGGCAVALVPLDSVGEFLSEVKCKYYDVDEYRSAQFDHNSMFVTSPSDGASVLKCIS